MVDKNQKSKSKNKKEAETTRSKRDKNNSSAKTSRKTKQSPKKNTTKKTAKSNKSNEKKITKPLKEPQTMEELLQQSDISSFSVKKGEVVEGKVISVSSSEMLLDIGRKSYGVVADWEMQHLKEYLKSLSIGDKIKAQVVSPENDMGYVVLSFRRASLKHRWEKLEKAQDEGTDLTMSGIETTKGGLLVDWQGLRGFIPSTQLEGSVINNPTSLVGKDVKVKVLEVDRSLNRLVVSQKAAMLGVTPKVQKERLEKIESGDILKGKVSGVAPFGVFIDIKGLEGLVHISEIAWEKVEDTSNLYKVGDEIEVMVIDINEEEGKLNLSVKRMTPDPWKNILDRYPIDSKASGEVVRSAPYGFFVQIEPGVEGLLHISKINPGEEPQVGQKLQCMIENIDPVKRKISLTLIPTEKPVGYR